MWLEREHAGGPADRHRVQEYTSQFRAALVASGIERAQVQLRVRMSQREWKGQSGPDAVQDC